MTLDSSGEFSHEALNTRDGADSAAYINIFENTTVPSDGTYQVFNDSMVYGHLEHEVHQVRNGRHLFNTSDYVTDEQNAKKMEWLKQYRSTRQRHFQILNPKDLAREEELIRFSVLSGKKEFKNYFRNEKGQIPSSLDHLCREVIVVEDGSEIGECCGVKLNYIQFLAKYDFEQTVDERQRDSKAQLKLSQADFEKRSLLEMLEFAS